MEKLVYLIDDDDIYHFTMKRLIKLSGLPYEIKSFGNGQQAYDYIQENKEKEDLLPEVIFLDINMPVKDGWEFLNDYVKLKENISKNIDVYIVSSSSNKSDMDRANGFNVVGYITKPVFMDQLKSCLA